MMNAVCLSVLLSLISASIVYGDGPQPDTVDRNHQLNALSRKGIEIYRHDRAAALASDAALEIRKFRRDDRVRGWITEAGEDTIDVTFVDENALALYRIRVPDKGRRAGKLDALEPAQPLAGYAARALAARNAALGSDIQPCSDRYNTVVLPGEGSADTFDVYMLPGTQKQNVVPIGGSYRITVEGGQVTSQRGFTKSCIELDKSGNTAGLMITHLLDHTPTEVHVYWSLWAGLPIYVSTSAGPWSVDKGRIEFVQR
jgi:hypothetical protein